MLKPLFGGTRDGEYVNAAGWQRVVYMQKLISDEEAASLVINDTMSWKHPEEVYLRNELGNFIYSHTVHYKPTQGER